MKWTESEMRWTDEPAYQQPTDGHTIGAGCLVLKFIETRAFEHSNSTELRSEAARAVL